jgi:sec-independent protein translocase protein TatA
MGLGTTEILLICLLALILFGGSKLADIGKGMGEGIKNFKKGLKESDEDDKEEAEPEEKKKPAAKASTKEKTAE